MLALVSEAKISAEVQAEVQAEIQAEIWGGRYVFAFGNIAKTVAASARGIAKCKKPHAALRPRVTRP